MKNKNLTPLSEKKKRQLAILEKYHEVDYENRTIDLELQYEKISDILENDISTKKYPKFKREVLERASEVIDTFPIDFKVNLKLKIDDLEGYKIDEVMDSFKDSLEMFHYATYKEKNKKWILAAIFTIVSVFLLFFKIFAGKNNMISEDGVVYEVLDIIAWVFLWEAVTVIFLSPGELREISMKLSRRLVSISFLNKDDQIISSITHADLTHDWVDEGKKESAGRLILLIAGAACVATGAVNIVSGVQGIFDVVGGAASGTNGLALSISEIVVTFVLAIAYIIGGIGAISIFSDKGPFQKTVPYFTYAFLALNTLLLIAVIGNIVVEYNAAQKFDGVSLAQAILSLLVTILFFISYLFVKSSNTKSKN